MTLSHILIQVGTSTWLKHFLTISKLGPDVKRRLSNNKGKLHVKLQTLFVMRAAGKLRKVN